MACNFEQLLKNNRVKAIGIPWSNEELNAIYKLSIPTDYVRQGILTKEDYEKERKNEKKSEKRGDGKLLIKMTKEELISKAKEIGLEFDEALTGRTDLMHEISVCVKKDDEKSTFKAKKNN